jgi:tRNA dimethylallyltransferase
VSSPQPLVIAVFGPTGVGKTAVAIALAEQLRARGEDPVAVSADALQVYAGMPILTGAAEADEQRQLEHRLIGFVPIDETFSAGAYAARAHREIDALIEAHRRPIVVGGTGLYLRAALAELDLKPPVDPAIRERLANDPRTLAQLHAELPEPVKQGIEPTDRQRILRVHELLAAGHAPPPPANAPNQLWTTNTRHPTLLAALTMDREALNARIEDRIDAMLAAGARQEVQRADAAGASETARRALGFQQLLDDDLEAMKTKTRQYAKRQVTWLRKLPGAHLIDTTDRTPEDVAAELIAMI